MQVGRRDKLALIAVGVAVATFLLFDFAVFPVWDSLQERRETLPIQEKKLEKYREVAATVGVRGAEVSTAEARLREAEGGLLSNKTSAMASAELQDLLKQLTVAQAIDVRSSEFLPVKAMGTDYTQVPLGVQFQCHVDQLANLLKAIGDSPKSLTVPRLSIQPTQGKEKILAVNMQVAGLIRAESSR